VFQDAWQPIAPWSCLAVPARVILTRRAGCNPFQHQVESSGDTFAYALSAVSGEPLLFKGGDFETTDVHAAAY
jgi:uncharacterized protein with PIN domain